MFSGRPLQIRNVLRGSTTYTECSQGGQTRPTGRGGNTGQTTQLCAPHSRYDNQRYWPVFSDSLTTLAPPLAGSRLAYGPGHKVRAGDDIRDGHSGAVETFRDLGRPTGLLRGSGSQGPPQGATLTFIADRPTWHFSRNSQAPLNMHYNAPASHTRMWNHRHIAVCMF